LAADEQDSDPDVVPEALPPRAVRTRPFSRLRQPVPLLVTGQQGAGKTMLFDAWDTSQRRQPAKTDRSIDDEQHPLEVSVGRRFLIFPRRLRILPTVVPGQPSPQRGLAFGGTTRGDRRPVGVIHVVCFGYAEIWDTESAIVRQALQAHPVEVAEAIDPADATDEATDADEAIDPAEADEAIDPAEADEAIDPAEAAARRLALVRAFNLREEVADFRATAERLATTWRGTRRVASPWLVIALAKCDLYHADLEAAKRYYSGADPASRFGKALRALTAKVPHLRVEVVPVSCDPKPYEPAGLQAAQEPELDFEQAAVLLDTFFRTVEDLCGAA
jgi:hypothetical protein